MIHSWKLTHGLRLDMEARDAVATVRCESCGVRLEPRDAIVRFMDTPQKDEYGGPYQITLVHCNRCEKKIAQLDQQAHPGVQSWPI